MRCAGERNPFASALPACLFPHFTSHKMLLQLTRDVPVRIYRSPKEKGTAALLLQEHKFPSVLLDHGAQTHSPDKVAAGEELAGQLVTWDITGRAPGDKLELAARAVTQCIAAALAEMGRGWQLLLLP